MNRTSRQEEPQTALETAIGNVRKAFLQRLDAQFQSLEDMADNFARMPGDRNSVQALAAEAHKIAGISKSVGLGTLGASARMSEDAIREFLAGAGGAVAQESVAETVDEMLNEIDAALSCWRNEVAEKTEV